MPKRGGSKGRKKPSLNDLSRQMPSLEGFEQFMNELDHMDDRAAALILTSMIDNLLELALIVNFVEMDAKTSENLFRNPNAMLSTFSAKISLGHALGVYGDNFKRHLDKVRAIRNAFAHAMLPIKFNEQLIADACNMLDPQALTDLKYQADNDTPKERFLTVGRLLAIHLLRYVRRVGQINQTMGRRQPSPDKFILNRAPNVNTVPRKAD